MVKAVRPFRQLRARDTLAVLIVVYGNPEDDDALPELEVPGRFPYEGGALSLAVAPVTDEDMCNVCGECLSVCPTGAISVEKRVVTKPELCIRCSACIKECPGDARSWDDEMMKEIATWLNENCFVRKEPRLFGIGWNA